ncbi:Transcriptional regulatory protein OmpR [Roseovarius indicus]|uniref:Transcriptional regulatory protein OmpR n=2 Tax=Roseovarius indicus TaxID=540747 RepID=A0A5P3AIF3_9RHOB|nr:Transcriptional regulatory protein OmpR [Roseovarius indicus]SFE66575.1 Response regulator receiver domain-containing protein [Roseovarius indicus]
MPDTQLCPIMGDAGMQTRGSDMSELERVLFVDDDPAIRDLIDVALSTVGGLSVRGFSSGEEAVAAAEAFGPQLLLLDVMMPDMDGPMTMSALKSLDSLASAPAVFLTAKVHGKEVDRLMGLGAVKVLSKPFDPMTLADELRAIWSETGGGTAG